MTSTHPRKAPALDGPSRLTPASALGFLELIVRGRIDRARQRTIETPKDLGASVVEWVIISALLVGIAATVAGILLPKIRDKANSIDLNAGNP